ncbi:MAG: hypothetical protein LUG99_22765 [Lachnospiraceae bacterium]|nr:hypothetical protein [Lachnospiraceae bacterium]
MVTVVDAMMGSGKTSWFVEHVNNNIDNNIMYIVPYLDVIKDIKERVTNREIYSPENLGRGKLDNLHYLLTMQSDIASTHALFLKLDNDCKEAIKQGHYTLYLDETLSAIEPFTLRHKDDISYLLKNDSIYVNNEGFIEWKDEDLDTRFNEIRILAQNHSLFYVNNKLLMWRYPPDIFSLFDNVYVMTFMFDASILKYYFELNGIDYTLKSVKKSEDGSYYLCDYYKPDLRTIRNKIHVYNNDDLNDSFPQKITALSATWFKNPSNKDKITKLKNNIYNYFSHKEKANNEKILWTTFKDQRTKLKGKGYSTGFLSFNCRSMNEYASRDHLCYCLNVYPHVGVVQFFEQRHLYVDQDKYALSEMVQWIWRSAIRNRNEIWIYVPSKRMRKLLTDWLKS